jgi:outer membrane protein TolC
MLFQGQRLVSLRQEVNAARNILKLAFATPGAGVWVLTELLDSVAQEAFCL